MMGAGKIKCSGSLPIQREKEMSKRKQTSGEEIANAVSHLVGSHLGAAMLALLVWQGATSGVDIPWKVTAGAIFGFCVMLLYAVSSVYHAVRYRPAKRILQKLDHMSIYFLIAGSYTPFCLVSLRPEHPILSWVIFGIEWSAVVAGVIFKVKMTGKYRNLSTLAYVLMGWVAVLAIVPLIHALHGAGTMWLVLGGGLYTIGSIFYLLDSLPYVHMVWHLFVLAGTISHFFCILWHVM